MLLSIPAAAAALAACGGSGSGSNASANSASTTKDASARSSRFASLRSCLEKEGINLPAASGNGGQPGTGGPPTGGAGGFKLPEGVSRSKLQEAMKKCGAGDFAGGARPGFSSATARAALTKYAACMRENGVNLPTPNTNGKGAVFNTKGINTSSETFKNAQKKCQSDLKGAFSAGRPPGGGEGAPPTGEGGPPAGGYGPPPGSETEAG